MFYVKTQVSKGVTITAEIHDDNVFTQCPECGKEHAIDLVDLLSDGMCDLYGTVVYCKCSKKRGATDGEV